MENSMEFSLKTELELPYDPAIPLLGVYSEKIIILHPNIYCSTIYNNQDMEKT